MKFWNLALISIMSIFLLGSCGKYESVEKFYILIEPDDTANFMSALASIAEEIGFSVKQGTATDDKGYTLYVLSARRRMIRIWSQNQPLSGMEDPLQCGTYTRPHPDPGQFFISITPLFFFVSESAVNDVANDVREKLSLAGFQIYESPEKCSTYSIDRSEVK